MAHAFRILNADDPVVARVARSAQVEAVRRKIRRETNEEDIAGYLSGSVEGDLALTSTSLASSWSRVRPEPQNVLAIDCAGPLIEPSSRCSAQHAAGGR